MFHRVFQGVLIVAMLGLSACGGQWTTDYNSPIDQSISSQWRVVSVDVVVPETLTVSNDNSIAPDADIVWWGDPAGDRRAQVAAIVEAGVEAGASRLNGGAPVHLLVVLSQFHGVTPRAVEIAPSAVHNIQFTVRVFDKRTGQEVTSAIVIDADLEAYVGAQAAAAAAQGVTEKQRIIAHIANVTAGWLGVGEDPRRHFGGLGR